MELTEIEIAQVTTRVLSGEAWSSVAVYFGMSQQKMRRIVADRLHLHVPTKKAVKQKRRKASGRRYSS